MSVNAQAPEVSAYREKGAALRRIASQVRSPDSRARLLALAESFDKLADRVEAWHEIAAAAG